MWHQREKRKNGQTIARIMPEGTICFAGRKLPVGLPSNEDEAYILREALNTFILLMSHRRGQSSDHFRYL